MADDQTPSPRASQGIAALPPQWQVWVQLVGTYGLAVVLVIYWVALLGPKFNRLSNTVEAMEKTVEAMEKVMENGCALSDEGVAQMNRLFVLSAPRGISRTIGTDLDQLARSGTFSGAGRDDEENQKLLDEVKTIVKVAIEVQTANFSNLISLCDGKNVADMLREPGHIDEVAEDIARLLMPGFDQPDQGFKFDDWELLHFCTRGIARFER